MDMDLHIVLDPLLDYSGAAHTNHIHDAHPNSVVANGPQKDLLVLPPLGGAGRVKPDHLLVARRFAR